MPCRIEFYTCSIIRLTRDVDLDGIAMGVIVKPRSYPTNIDEEATVLIKSGMVFVFLKSCPLDTPGNLIWFLISKPYLHSGKSHRYSDISRAQLPRLTYSNSCLWPAGLVVTIMPFGGPILRHSLYFD